LYFFYKNSMRFRNKFGMTSLGIFYYTSLYYFFASSSHSYTRSKPNLPNFVTVTVVPRLSLLYDANKASRASSTFLKYCGNVIFVKPFDGKGISSVNFSTFSTLKTTLWSLSVASRINPGKPYHFQGPAFIGILGVNHASNVLLRKAVIAL